MAKLERYMFYYLDTIIERDFKEAIQIAQEMLSYYEGESTPVIEGFLNAARSLEALKCGDFDQVEELWNRFESSKNYITRPNKHYALLMEISLILENTKEEIERII